MEAKVLREKAFGLPVTWKVTEFAYDKTSCVWFRPLADSIQGAVITNQRIGKGNNLICIGWICQNFLVASHACVEYNLTYRWCPAKDITFKDGTIF